jgi:hypothetical protein
LAGLVPTARGPGHGAALARARAFARLQWPAYALLVITASGMCRPPTPASPGPGGRVLVVKIVVVLAGVAAWLHSRSTTKAGLAVWGATTALASVTALALGVFLAG